MPDAATRDYDALLAEARTLYPGVRIGRPGRARTYWATIAAMRLLRVRWAVDIDGADRVAPGPAILIGNHVHFMDPVCVVIAVWWRASAFTKLEWFEHRGSLFFRLMGQIPLRRGDAGLHRVGDADVAVRPGQRGGSGGSPCTPRAPARRTPRSCTSCTSGS